MCAKSECETTEIRVGYSRHAHIYIAYLSLGRIGRGQNETTSRRSRSFNVQRDAPLSFRWCFETGCETGLVAFVTIFERSMEKPKDKSTFELSKSP